MRSHDTEVLVVGAGPVGLVLAIELARRAVPVRIIDRRSEPTDESRAVVVHARSLEMMDALGVVEEMIASGRRTTGVQFHADDTVLARVALDTVDSPYPFSVTTAQTETERILTERLTQLGIAVERGVELTELTQNDHGVQAVVVDAEAHSSNIACRYLVGADGASSVVRHRLGLKLEGAFKGERFLMGDVDATYDLERSAMHIFASSGTGPAMIFPMVGDRVRVIAEIGDTDREPSMQWLQEVCDERGLGATVSAPRWLTTFEIHHAQVARYRTGRVFLAGDAAHVHSPAGGQGMNTGMQDAFNLGWKLAASVAGNASDKVLDSYHDERHPVAARVIKETTAMTRGATLESKFARTVRNHVLHAAASFDFVQRRIADEMEEYTISYRKSPIVQRGVRARVHAGDAAPQVAGTDLWARLMQARHDNPGEHTLLAIGAPHAVSLPGAATVSVDDAAVAERYGLTAHGGLVLIRPDGYIATVAATDDVASVKAAVS